MAPIVRKPLLAVTALLLAVALLFGLGRPVRADYIFTTLDPPGSIGTTAYGINDSDQVVGDYFDRSGVFHGFLATPRPIPEPASVLLFRARHP
jgi:hypothetical protein